MPRNVWIIIAVVVLALGGWYFLQSQKSQVVSSPATTVQTESSPATDSAATASPQASSSVMVTIGSTGFSPKDITIKVGEKVTWKNTDSVAHTVNSAPHPTHTAYPPLNAVGNLSAGEEKSFTFDTPGTYKYHDHLNSSLTGSVTVQ